MTIANFLSQFYPDPAEPLWLRTFDAKGLPPGVSGFPQNIETCTAELQTNQSLQHRLLETNKTQGVYFVVNAGGKKDSDITRINAIFCEIDDKPIEEQHDIFDNQSPWTPSIRIETRKSVHAYWLLSEQITTENFLELQQGLIKFYNSDKSIKNLSRVMRLPFLNHVRWENGYQYQRVNCHTFSPDLRYSLAELRQAYPHTPEPSYIAQFGKPSDAPSGRIETLEDVKTELRSRIMALPSWKAHGKWGSANGVCHNGEGPTGLRVDLASGAVTCWSNCSLKQILNAFGLDLPSRRKFDYVQPPEQVSDLYRWLKERDR